MPFASAGPLATSNSSSMGWKETAAARQRQVWAQAPPEWRVSMQGASPARAEGKDAHAPVRDTLTPAQQQITECKGSDLLQALARGDITAVEALSAFGRRALLAHHYTRCLCENNRPAARDRVRELDVYWRTHGVPAGPLHGLTVSLMDRFHVQGLDTACGFVSWLNAKRTAEDEGDLVRTLRHLGAVVHCKTNVPMSLMLGETANNIIGTTLNPSNLRLSAGGACGGEGALIALRGSAMGVGTDVAGSSRIPAAFCGLWSLKCSEHRLPQDGIATVLSGLPNAEGAVGLMANDPEILAFAFKSMVNSAFTSTDHDLLPIPWRQDALEAIRRRKNNPGMANGRLVFGILPSDGHVRPHPPIQRALNIVMNALRQCGHEVIEWNPPSHTPAVEVLFKILGSTSASEARAALKASGEPPIPQLETWYHHQDLEPSNSAEFWALCAQRRQFCADYKAYWNNMAATTQAGRMPDGVIMPVAPTLAVRPGEYRYYGYSAIVNALDYASGVFPVMRADRSLDDIVPGLEPLSELDNQIQSSYPLDDAHGLPVGLQVMVPRLQEESALGLLEVISECLQEA